MTIASKAVRTLQSTLCEQFNMCWCYLLAH